MTLIPLSPAWNAVVLPDGKILIQHRRGFLRTSGMEIDLASVNEETANALQEIGTEEMLVRYFLLLPDGSLQTDLFGVSPAGIPRTPYIPFPAAHESVGAYLLRFQAGFVAEQALDQLEQAPVEIDIP